MATLVSREIQKNIQKNLSHRYSRPQKKNIHDTHFNTILNACPNSLMSAFLSSPFPFLNPKRDPVTNRWLPTGGNTANRPLDIRRFRERLEQGSLLRSVREGTKESQRLSHLGHLLRVPRMDRLQPGSKSLCLRPRDCLPHGLVSNRIVIKICEQCSPPGRRNSTRFLFSFN